MLITHVFVVILTVCYWCFCCGRRIQQRVGKTWKNDASPCEHSV